MTLRGNVAIALLSAALPAASAIAYDLGYQVDILPILAREATEAIHVQTAVRVDLGDSRACYKVAAKPLADGAPTVRVLCVAPRLDFVDASRLGDTIVLIRPPEAREGNPPQQVDGLTTWAVVNGRYGAFRHTAERSAAVISFLAAYKDPVATAAWIQAHRGTTDDLLVRAIVFLTAEAALSDGHGAQRVALIEDVVLSGRGGAEAATMAVELIAAGAMPDHVDALAGLAENPALADKTRYHVITALSRDDNGLIHVRRWSESEKGPAAIASRKVLLNRATTLPISDVIGTRHHLVSRGEWNAIKSRLLGSPAGRPPLVTAMVPLASSTDPAAVRILADIARARTLSLESRINAVSLLAISEADTKEAELRRVGRTAGDSLIRDLAQRELSNLREGEKNE